MHFKARLPQDLEVAWFWNKTSKKCDVIIETTSKCFSTALLYRYLVPLTTNFRQTWYSQSKFYGCIRIQSGQVKITMWVQLDAVLCEGFKQNYSFRSCCTVKKIVLTNFKHYKNKNRINLETCNFKIWPTIFFSENYRHIISYKQTADITCMEI